MPADARARHAGLWMMLLSAAAVACGPPDASPRAEQAAAAVPPPPAARVLVEQARAAENPRALAALAPRVQRPAWDRLVITAENGTRREFTDEVRGGELRSVHHLVPDVASLPGFVVVRQHVPEGREVLLVHRRTGAVTGLDEIPVPSPDGKRFATASLDLVAGHAPNRIRIYRVQPAGQVLEWEARPAGWGARAPVWADGGTLRLERGVVDWNTHELRTSPLVLRRQAGGWVVQPSRDHARDALLAFLSALGQKRYPEAAQHYGGSYGQLRTWNPAIPPTDLPALWRAACEGNGLRCMGRAEVLRAEELSPTETRFTVRLLNDRGEPLVLGPCCGETEATMPTRREFSFRVRRAGERYLVTDLPPYSP